MSDVVVPDVHGSPERPLDGSGQDTEAGPLRAWAGLVVLVAARAYRAALLTFVLVATVPLLLHWTSNVVRTGSMEPQVDVGDVVVARPFGASEEVPVGRVLVFHNPAASGPRAERPLLVHRVVEAGDDGTFVTKGDANRDADATPLTHADIRSRAMLLVPFVGKPFVWIAERRIDLLVGWLLLTVAAFVVAVRRAPGDRGGRGGRGGRGPRARLARLLRRLRRAGRAAVPAPVAVPAARTALPTSPADEPRTHRRPSRRPRLRTVVPLLVVATCVLGWSGGANAAFTARTTNPGSGWTVSASLATRVTLADPGPAVRGTVALSATLSSSDGLAYAVRIESAPAGTTTWRTICTDSSAPYGCSWATAGLTNQAYDLRAVAVSSTSTVTSEVVEDVTVDNAAPTVTLADPGTPLRGTVTLTATASDADSGVDRVLVQRAVNGSSTWVDVCTTTESPYTCRLDTTTLADGAYSFRATATDEAGNTTTSAVVANRTVDNRVASVSVTDPGANLSGTVQVEAAAYAPAGIASVRLQRAPTGTTTWTDLCLDTTAPYACTWDTTTVATGGYDLRAVLTDAAGKLTTSATVSNRRVDNSPVRAYDVQTVQGGTTAGRLDQGDRITFTYSGQVRPASISAGWTGTAIPVTVRLRDGALLGTGSTGDTLDVLRSGATVALGSVNLRQNFIGSLRTAQLNATMTASTVTVNGTTATQVTIVLGTLASGTVRTTSTAAAMTWTPSTAVQDLNGRAVSSVPVTELGASDRDF